MAALFDPLEQYWRHLGPIHMIAGWDLALRNIGLTEGGTEVVRQGGMGLGNGHQAGQDGLGRGAGLACRAGRKR